MILSQLAKLRWLARHLIWGWAWERHWAWPGSFVNQRFVPPRLRLFSIGVALSPAKWTIGLSLNYMFETMGWVMRIELPMLTLRISWARHT